jgi:hypothetical protein
LDAQQLCLHAPQSRAGSTVSEHDLICWQSSSTMKSF